MTLSITPDVARTDPRPIKEKPAAGPIAARITAKASPLRAAERVKVLLEAGPLQDWQATVGKTTYTLSISDGVQAVGNAVFVPRVVASPAPPVPLDPGGYYFVNPPVLVDDGTDHVDVAADNSQLLTPNFKEDPAEALRQMIAATVLRQPPAAASSQNAGK